MTTIHVDPATPVDTANQWDAELAKVRARFPKAQDTVVFCIHTMQHDPDVHVEDLKARAQMHGLRVTGAAVSAARRLLGLDPPRPRRERAEPEPSATRDLTAAASWPAAREALAAEFPAEKEGIRYCVFRLRRVPGLSFLDIRDDAKAAGIKLGGRSLHSARALIAGGAGGVERKTAAPRARSSTDEILARLREFDANARGEAERLRAAIARVLNVIDDALQPIGS